VLALVELVEWVYQFVRQQEFLEVVESGQEGSREAFVRYCLNQGLE